MTYTNAWIEAAAHLAKRERNEQIYLAREAGQTFTALAQEHGITCERVRQIWSRERWRRQ